MNPTTPATSEVFDKIAVLERAVAALTVRVQRLEAAALPEGWVPTGLTLVADPAVSMCPNSDTKVWSVWRFGPTPRGTPFPTPIVVGKSIEEVARAYAAKSKS